MTRNEEDMHLPEPEPPLNVCWHGAKKILQRWLPWTARPDVPGDVSGYDPSFFETEVGDRKAAHSVKHGLKQGIFGAEAKDAIPMWVADMDLPGSLEITNALRRRLDHATLGYTYQPRELWAAVSAWLKQEHGWTVDTEAFVFCPSVVTAAAACLWAYTSPGDTVLLMTPLYGPLQDAVSASGRTLRKHELRLSFGRFVFDAERLARDLEGCRMLVLCNPHNPGGRVWSPQELRMVAEMCHARGVVIVSDDIWADWGLFGHAYSPIANKVAPGQPVVTLMAPTKTWNLGGLQASFLVIQDKALREKYLKTISYTFLHFGSTFATEGMLAAYREGGRWLQSAKLHVEAQLKHCEAVLLECCSPEIIPYRPQGTYLMWLDCSGLQVSDPFQYLLEEAKVILSPGTDFGGDAEKQFARINVATSRKVLDCVLSRLAEAVETNRRSRGNASTPRALKDQARPLEEDAVAGDSGDEVTTVPSKSGDSLCAKPSDASDEDGKQVTASGCGSAAASSDDDTSKQVAEASRPVPRGTVRAAPNSCWASIHARFALPVLAHAGAVGDFGSAPPCYRAAVQDGERHEEPVRQEEGGLGDLSTEDDS